MFSCEFCEISKNAFFYRTPPVATSDLSTTETIVARKKYLLEKKVISCDQAETKQNFTYTYERASINSVLIKNFEFFLEKSRYKFFLR